LIQRAEEELALIEALEALTAEPLEKCRALWELITTGREDAVLALLKPKENAEVKLAL
jgi:hypothetical protein